MYLDISLLHKNGHTYKRVLLRESYREQGKVKKRTIANLSACSEKEIEAIKLAFRHKSDLSEVASVTVDLTLRQGPSIGAVWLGVQDRRPIGCYGGSGQLTARQAGVMAGHRARHRSGFAFVRRTLWRQSWCMRRVGPRSIP